jgi:ribonuclease-3
MESSLSKHDLEDIGESEGQPRKRLRVTTDSEPDRQNIKVEPNDSNGLGTNGRPMKPEGVNEGIQGDKNGKSKKKYKAQKNRNENGKRTDQKTTQNTNPGVDPIMDLMNGLTYILQRGHSEEIMHHAKELQRLLFLESFSKDNRDQTDGTVRSSRSDTSQVSASITDVASTFGYTHYPPSANPALGMLNSITPATSSHYVAVAPVSATNSTSTQSSVLPILPPITEPTLISAPFTHSSSLPSYVKQTGTNCYEPLEFLGDAYLEIIATRLIHSRFPEHAVGQKSRLREWIVRNENLANYARAYEFQHRIVATDMVKTGSKGGFEKVLADCFEAYVAALILSDPVHGFQTAEAWLTALWAPRILEWIETEGKDAIHESANVHSKKDLETLIVSRDCKIEYLEEKPMEITPNSNLTKFTMGCYFTGFGFQKIKLGTGQARSKALAGHEAAKDAMTNNRKMVDDLHERKLKYDRAHPKKPWNNQQQSHGSRSGRPHSKAQRGPSGSH